MDTSSEIRQADETPQSNASRAEETPRSDATDLQDYDDMSDAGGKESLSNPRYGSVGSFLGNIGRVFDGGSVGYSPLPDDSPARLDTPRPSSFRVNQLFTTDSNSTNDEIPQESNDDHDSFREGQMSLPDTFHEDNDPLQVIAYAVNIAF